MSAIIAYIGLGSNLQNPVNQVRSAIDELDKIPETLLIKTSSLYRSDPVGPPGQPDYINAVAGIETQLEPLPLLRELQAIEQTHQRVRDVRWGPRTLDLDLLIYGDRLIREPDLIVPHIQIAKRPFVLIPLAEIAPNQPIPGLRPLDELLKTTSREGLSRLE